MSADTVTRLSLPPRSPEIGAGHELAFEMFDELLGEDGSGTPADAALLDRNYRHGRPYRDVVADYLERAHKAGPGYRLIPLGSMASGLSPPSA